MCTLLVGELNYALQICGDSPSGTVSLNTCDDVQHNRIARFEGADTR